jgi:hypothetical protein
VYPYQFWAKSTKRHWIAPWLVVLNSAYPFPEFSEGFATLNDICPSWKTQIGFINHGEILGEKGTELGAVITTSFSERAT